MVNNTTAIDVLKLNIDRKTRCGVPPHDFHPLQGHLK
jgi:hypothetical protein